MAKKRLIVIGGPTASGKTEAAIAIARHVGTEIVGADARQVYAELAIGVGRPSPDQLAAVNHHMIGHVSIHQHYSVGHYLQDALPVIDRLLERHDTAILVGGTGLYIQAVLQGIDEIPAVPEALVGEWTRIAKEEGLSRLQAETARLDPEYYAIVDRQNPARLIRAITVSLHTGRPYSTFRTGGSAARTFDPILLQADLPRDVLYARIDRRVDDMLQHGWLDEARAMLPYK
jgi:tRNA dimethylallyltransferase